MILQSCISFFGRPSDYVCTLELQEEIGLQRLHLQLQRFFLSVKNLSYNYCGADTAVILLKRLDTCDRLVRDSSQIRLLKSREMAPNLIFGKSWRLACCLLRWVLSSSLRLFWLIMIWPGGFGLCMLACCPLCWVMSLWPGGKTAVLCDVTAYLKPIARPALRWALWLWVRAELLGWGSRDSHPTMYVRRIFPSVSNVFGTANLPNTNNYGGCRFAWHK